MHQSSDSRCVDLAGAINGMTQGIYTQVSKCQVTKVSAKKCDPLAAESQGEEKRPSMTLDTYSG